MLSNTTFALPSLPQAALQLRRLATSRLVLQQKDLRRDLSEMKEKGLDSASDESARALEGKLKAIESR